MVKFNNIEFYCISLISRSDRRKQVQKLFNKLNIPIKWWIVDKHPKGGRFGAFESHVCIWDTCVEDIIVIFEDDIELMVNPRTFYQYLNEAIHLTSQYSTVHLGCYPLQLHRRIDTYEFPGRCGNFWEGRFLTSTCYVARKESLKQLSREIKPYYGAHMDMVLAMMTLNHTQVGLLPTCFRQDLSDSNNSWIEDIPIIGNVTELNDWLRRSMQQDNSFLLKWPNLFTIIVFKLFIWTSSARTAIYGGAEFRDRRVK